MTTPTQAAEIRKAALGPTPLHPHNTHVWMGAKYGKGPNRNGDRCDEFRGRYPEDDFCASDDDTQRTFLLFVACALEG